jgi:hypothetical protein
MRIRSRRPSAGLVVAFIALLVALGGTALAATGQLVNIADGTNSAYLAKVDSAGAVKTAGTNVPSPGTPFRTSSSVSNFYANGNIRPTLFTTTATLAITRITYANPIGNADPWEAAIWYVPIPSGGTCTYSNPGVKRLELVAVPAKSTLVEPLPTPIVLKPAAAGQSWCMVAVADQPTTAGNPEPMEITFVGYVTSGTFNAPSNEPAPNFAKDSPTG